jgi:hypothetical protein
VWSEVFVTKGERRRGEERRGEERRGEERRRGGEERRSSPPSPFSSSYLLVERLVAGGGHGIQVKEREGVMTMAPLSPLLKPPFPFVSWSLGNRTAI